MDDVFEVLIYLLFIGASIAGSIYKNYLKKKEEEKQRQIKTQPATNEDFEEQYVEPETKNSPIPRTLEEFLNSQFEIESEDSSSIEENWDSEAETYNTLQSKSEITKEGMSAFSSTTETLLSDNLNEPDFSISTEIDNQIDATSIASEEKKAFEYPSDKEDFNFDLHQAVIYSEILNRPYQE